MHYDLGDRGGKGAQKLREFFQNDKNCGSREAVGYCVETIMFDESGRWEEGMRSLPLCPMTSGRQGRSALVSGTHTIIRWRRDGSGRKSSCQVEK